MYKLSIISWAGWIIVSTSLWGPQSAWGDAQNAGLLLQQLEASKAPGSTLKKKRALSLPSSVPPRQSKAAPSQFQVNKIALQGNTLLATEILLANWQDQLPGQFNLNQLQQLCLQISQVYLQHGYPLVSAIVPAQDITSGTLLLKISEAKLGAAKVENHTLLSSRQLDQSLANLKHQQAIKQSDLERSLLLLNDTPGVSARAVFSPSAAPNHSDLTIIADAQRRYFATVGLSNFGSEALNRERLNLNAGINNPFGQPARVTSQFISSGKPFNYAKLDYQGVLNSNGLSGHLAWSGLNYELNGELSGAKIRGDVRQFEAGLRFAITRSMDNNLYASANIQHSSIADQSGLIRQDRNINQASVALAGDFLLADDNLSSYWRLALTTGELDFNNQAAEIRDQFAAQTAGNFSLINIDLNQRFWINDASQLTLSLAAQWAADNLDSSQKLVLGGPNNLGAYDVGAVSGDSGYKAKIEYQRFLIDSGLGRFYGALFIDFGHVKQNQSAWQRGVNGVSLKGAGAAINWLGPDGWNGRITLSNAIGDTPPQLRNVENNIIWIELNKTL